MTFEQFVCDHRKITAFGIQIQHTKLKSDGFLETETACYGQRTYIKDSPRIDKDTANGIGSITKMFTASTLLKLYDNELTRNIQGEMQYFPDGMETKLSYLMPKLMQKFPDVKYLQTIAKVPHYEQITFRDLLNHTHGLGGRDEEKVSRIMLEDTQKQFTCAEMVDFTIRNEEKDKYGEFNYSNLGPDLSGMIIELITNKSYDKALKDEVLIPIGATRTYTQEELPKLYQNEDFNIACGYNYTVLKEENDKILEGEINTNSSCNTRGAGGLKTTPGDMEKFIRKFLSKKAGSSSLFKNQQVVDELWNRQDRNYHFCVIEHKDGFYGHNGSDGCFLSAIRYNPDTQESYYYCTVGERLTGLVAFLTLEKEIRDDKTIREEKTLERKKELMNKGYGFYKLKEMMEEGKSISQIAENIKGLF